MSHPKHTDSTAATTSTTHDSATPLLQRRREQKAAILAMMKRHRDVDRAKTQRDPPGRTSAPLPSRERRTSRGSSLDERSRRRNLDRGKIRDRLGESSRRDSKQDSTARRSSSAVDRSSRGGYHRGHSRIRDYRERIRPTERNGGYSREHTSRESSRKRNSIGIPSSSREENTGKIRSSSERNRSCSVGREVDRLRLARLEREGNGVTNVEERRTSRSTPRSESIRRRRLLEMDEIGNELDSKDPLKRSSGHDDGGTRTRDSCKKGSMGRHRPLDVSERDSRRIRDRETDKQRSAMDLSDRVRVRITRDRGSSEAEGRRRPVESHVNVTKPDSKENDIPLGMSLNSRMNKDERSTPMEKDLIVTKTDIKEEHTSLNRSLDSRRITCDRESREREGRRSPIERHSIVTVSEPKEQNIQVDIKHSSSCSESGVKNFGRDGEDDLDWDSHRINRDSIQPTTLDKYKKKASERSIGAISVLELQDQDDSLIGNQTVASRSFIPKTYSNSFSRLSSLYDSISLNDLNEVSSVSCNELYTRPKRSPKNVIEIGDEDDSSFYDSATTPSAMSNLKNSPKINHIIKKISKKREEVSNKSSPHSQSLSSSSFQRHKKADHVRTMAAKVDRVSASSKVRPAAYTASTKNNSDTTKKAPGPPGAKAKYPPPPSRMSSKKINDDGQSCQRPGTPPPEEMDPILCSPMQRRGNNPRTSLSISRTNKFGVSISENSRKLGSTGSPGILRASKPITVNPPPFHRAEPIQQVNTPQSQRGETKPPVQNGPPNDGPTKTRRGVNLTLQRQTSATPQSSHESTRNTAGKVADMPYTDSSSGGGYGMYTGDVDQWGRPHGTGKIEYDGGASYNGEWVNGVPQAKTQFHPGFAQNSQPAVLPCNFNMPTMAAPGMNMNPYFPMNGPVYNGRIQGGYYGMSPMEQAGNGPNSSMPNLYFSNDGFFRRS